MRSLESQMQWHQRARVVLALLLCAGAIAFYLLGYRPTAARLQAIQVQIDAKKGELAQNSNKTSNMEFLAREVVRLESQVKDFDRKFPRPKELPQFIREITPLSQHLALAEWKYEPGLPRRADGCIEMPIFMHFGGDFVNAASFLRQVENMQQLTRVKRFDVKTKDRATGTVQVEMLMNIYFAED
jgi:Tfp pilus assembly protein PilO